jgi:hypothetical protein
MSAPALEIAPAEFWRGLDAALDDAIRRGLEASTEGLTIAAPASVKLGVHETLPLAGVRVGPFAEVLRAPLYQALVVCSCVETGEVRTQFAAPRPEELSPADQEPGEGTTGECFQIDLFELHQLPKRPATWVIRVLLLDQVSNAVTVQIAKPPTEFVDPAAEALILEALRKPVLRALNPRPALDGGLPSYEPLAETPPPPASPGIQLKLKRAQMIELKASLLVHGSFLCNVLPRDARPPPAKDAPKLRGPRPTAAVPMTLVVFGSRRPGATLVPMVVPIYQPLQGEGDARTGTGSFAFDYFALTGVELAPQTLFFYAFAGTLMSNLALCALVDRSELHQ